VFRNYLDRFIHVTLRYFVMPATQRHPFLVAAIYAFNVWYHPTDLDSRLRGNDGCFKAILMN